MTESGDEKNASNPTEPLGTGTNPTKPIGQPPFGGPADRPFGQPTPGAPGHQQGTPGQPPFSSAGQQGAPGQPPFGGPADRPPFGTSGQQYPPQAGQPYGQAGQYGQPGQPGQPGQYGQPGQPYGQQQYYGTPPGYYYPEQKSRLVGGLLGILLGGLGVHRFYLGHIGIGVLQIVVTFLTFGVGAVWGFIEGIMILVGAEPFKRDARGVPLKE
ncbi:NINE protein [Arthrobacter sp. CAU 1506]|uniref:TM2 domain-containing protein n=1 Tax=Arthrobacter sp. CAU 1506 TaxID=2560052 RepID=UPI0010AC6060|nr:TM2 domain-containing protein [Arthrobacter sp. CAU 1506]TJY67489.1 NINE protein [Arthrobacter sp. CAU 1506]